MSQRQAYVSQSDPTPKTITTFVIDALLLQRFKEQAYIKSHGSVRGAISKAVNEALQLWLEQERAVMACTPEPPKEPIPNE